MRLPHLSEKVKAGGTAVFERGDPRYPPLLQEIPQPPTELWVRGNADVFKQTLVAIVGTRRASDEGLAFARLLTQQLNGVSEIVTVSGLAFGIDATVHQAAVAGGRPTIAVLASGVDQPTPASHEKLAADLLAAGGCLVSEYPPGTAPFKDHFPARNRIIAGLSRATVVVEAGEPSGALITAYLALDANREVLAVPGSPLNPSAAGTIGLLRRGAAVCTSADDILDALRLARRPVAVVHLAADGDRSQLLDHLDVPRTIDQLLKLCTMVPARLSALLSVLELEGHIRVLPDQRVVRTDSLRAHQPRHR